MNLIASFRRILLLLLFSFFMITLSACFMMPLMVGALYETVTNDKGDPNVNAAVNNLIEESIGALDGERGLFDRILIGEIKVKDNLISVGKLRQILLETLRARNMGPVLEQDDRVDSSFESQVLPISAAQEMLTVLNTQFYQAADQIWLAQQLVDMRTDRILWTGIYARPLSNSTQDIENDTSLTIGS